MSEKKIVKPVALAVGAALASSIAMMGSVNAEGLDNPFEMTTLSAGYMLGGGEGSCGEGSCGGDDDEKEGEGSCGEGSCGGDSDEEGEDDKEGEGSCGEGSCGGDADEDKEGEGSCGEGSCGGSV